VAVFQVYKRLAWLNELPSEEGRKVLLGCCGSTAWAEQMDQRRPFRMLEDLFEAARVVWFRLPTADWLEAFAAHPQIGGDVNAKGQNERSGEWSKEEQSGITVADRAILKDLLEANRLYRKKFGFIFIVCATGKSAEEMLAISRARYGNSAETELQIAAEEQFKITEIRLYKLLEQ
jgi:2-oxo-4-hydroxy-4-carboxy-5-ureidoimidazoline decarboxylase